MNAHCLSKRPVLGFITIQGLFGSDETFLFAVHKKPNWIKLLMYKLLFDARYVELEKS